MVIVKMKPTSAGHRGMVCVVAEGLHKGASYAPLLEKKNFTAGRNNNGRIATHHKGGGHRRHHRVVDSKHSKNGILAKVERIEYDPNHTAFIALLCYADGERRYIVAPRGTRTGAVLVSGAETAIKVGNTLPIRSIPVGTTIRCIEMKPGRGAQTARSAGTSAALLAKEGAYAQARLCSGEAREINVDCRATIGEVGNEGQNLKKIGRAGANRWRGIRPAVRGVVMNPVDRPRGGGRGRTNEAREPVSPWGTPAKGYRTHNNKRTDNTIVHRRYSNKG